jgi:hypothetical protein
MISNKIRILLLSILGVIFIQFGLLVFLQILIGLIVFFTSNFLSGINPFNLEYRIIRILSIILIIYILWYNSIEIAIHTSVLLPLSIDKIDYLKILNRFVKIEEKLEEKRLLIFDIYKISDFVNNLEDDNSLNLSTNSDFVRFSGLMNTIEKFSLFWTPWMKGTPGVINFLNVHQIKINNK